MSVGKGIQLEHDTALPIQSHFNILTQRATLGFVLMAIFAFVIMTKIDVILGEILNHLNPGDGSLSLYEPASWSAVRWLSAVFLSILLLLPLAIYSMYTFVQQGLTNRELAMFKRWTLLSAITGYATLFLLFYYAIPTLYVFGDGIHEDMNLEAKYDAVSLFTFALSIYWTMLITYIIAFSATAAGTFGLITENNQDWWRTRILGGGSLVVLFTLPGGWNGINILLVCAMIVVLEFSIRKSVRKSSQILKLKPIFDNEGRRRSVLYVESSYTESEVSLNKMLSHTDLMRFESLRTNIEERNVLIDTIIRYRITDVVMSGCKETELPSAFKLAITSASCGMWFLQNNDEESLLNLHNRILRPNNLPNT